MSPLLSTGALLFGLAATAAEPDVSSVWWSPALRTASDTPTSLAEQAAGRPMAVVVMKGTWCGACVAQLRTLAGQPALTEHELATVGLTTEPAARLAMVDPLPVVADPTHAITEALGLWRPADNHSMPALVLFDRCGNERYRLTGRRPGRDDTPLALRRLAALAKEEVECPPGPDLASR